MSIKARLRSKKGEKSRSGTELLLPLVPTKDLVPLPGVVFPLYLGVQNSGVEGGESAIDFARRHGNQLVLALDRSTTKKKRDVAPVGGLVRIVQSVKLSAGEYKLRLEVQGRVRIERVVSSRPFLKVEVSLPENAHHSRTDSSTERLMFEIKERFSLLMQYDPGIEASIVTAESEQEPGALADIIASSIPLSVDEAQGVLEEFHPLKRLKLVARLLGKHINVITLRERVVDKAQHELGQLHHRELLREQLRQIQEELGESDPGEAELRELEKRVSEVGLPAVAKREAERQLQRLKHLHPEAAESALVRTYIEWILDLPWSKRTKDRVDLAGAKRILERDHFGLEKTKERILDYLSVRKLRKELRGPVLLLVGPPGVGKTSLGRSIAEALGRKFVRISVGGLRDEAELRGHRRTYVGALPGRILQALKSVGVKNPVLMLDELDKVGSDFRGDPASVLLEVLDPEQNRSFEDHYLNIPFDLSEVVFIATANVVDSIPAALRDRLEVIQLAGYTTEEKLQIAKQYLVPREQEENGLKDRTIIFPEASLRFLIESYTRESGVRELGRCISTVFRKVARRVAEEQRISPRIQTKQIEAALGPVRFVPERTRARDEVGVVTGLAWTPVGGESLLVEASLTPGKGTLSLTGQLGEVMRESALAALTYVQSHAERFGIDPLFYERSNVHIHVPQGAIAKDGPSAGVAIAVALVSLLTGRPVSRDVAMTGEITLRGTVLEIGGLKEKALAALRLGVKTVIIPKDNERELVEFPPYLLEQVTFLPVSHVSEVLAVAFRSRAAQQPVKRKRSQPSKAILV